MLEYMKVLELFSGTGSVGKVCKKKSWDVVSVDLMLPADHQVDIMEFDYKQYPKGYFDIIWASPPCTEYSAMNYCRPEKIPDIEGANKLVNKTLEIIRYFNPTYWFIENPQTGTLKNQDLMKDLPYYDVDYCKYGNPIRKRTRIWTNKKDFKPLLCKRDCESIKDGKHLSFRYYNIKGQNRLHLRYKIPEKLIEDLFTFSS
jgi:site-specific DNA-cytosine methylase